MLVDFIYETPSYLLLLLTMLVTCSFTLFGIWITDYFLSKSKLSIDNTAISAISRPISTIYAVLIAFIAITTLNTYNQAQTLLHQESGLINSIYHSADSMPPAIAKDIHEHIKSYTYHVVHHERPDLRREKRNASGADDLNHILSNIGKYNLNNNVEIILLDNMLEQLNKLYELRRERNSLIEAAISPLVWYVLVLFSILLIVINLLFTIESKVTKFISLQCVALSISLMLFLLMELDHPFRGEMSASFKTLRLQLQLMETDYLLNK